MASYDLQYYIGIGIAVAAVMVGAIIAAGATSLGLEPTTIAWLGIASAGLGALSRFFPSALRPPNEARRRGKDA